MLAGHDRGVLQSGELAVPRLSAVFDAEQFAFGPPGVFLAPAAEALQQDLLAKQPLQAARQLAVANVLQVGDRIHPIGVARMAGDEHQLSFGGARRAPVQIIGNFRGMSVLVHAKQADVQIVARVFEIVGIAAEERDGLLWSEHQADIGVALVAIQVIEPTVIKRNHVAAQAGGVERLLLDRVDRRPPRLVGFGRRHLRSHRGLDFRGHVFDALQHVQFGVERAELVGPRLGMKTAGEIIVFRAAQFLQCASADMVIREHESVGRDERAAAAVVEADRRALQMLQPGVGRIEAVPLAEHCPRRIGEQPHPLFGVGDRIFQSHRQC